MSSFDSEAEALHAMLIFFKPRHWQVLDSIVMFAGKEGVIYPYKGTTVLKMITEQSEFQATTVTEVINELEEAGLIKRYFCRSEEGKSGTAMRLFNPALYQHWAIHHLLGQEMFWYSKHTTIVQSERWQEALELIGGSNMH